MKKLFYALTILVTMSACHLGKEKQNGSLRLITLDPGHFHASLILKSMLPAVDSQVYLYAPQGTELLAYQNLIESYNNRAENPTAWSTKAYIADDFLEKMLAERPGDIVLLAGNNKKKTEYIYKSVDAGMHVLSDKPMAINQVGFRSLVEAFELAESKKVLLFDMMTERYNIYSILQKELVQNPSLFGVLEKGSVDKPAILKSSIHHFYKEVSGKPLIRPNWYYDVKQEGEGIVDVTTHAIDLIQWQCFPNALLDYQQDVKVLKSTRYPTVISQAQYKKSTGDADFADFLVKDVQDNQLSVYANGDIDYTLKGVHVKVAVEWAYQAAPGAGDTHVSSIRGSRATVSLRQGQAEGFKPTLYVEPSGANPFTAEDLQTIEEGFAQVAQRYPGISLQATQNGFKVVVPDALIEGHEEHFAKLAVKFLSYVRDGKLPEWEKSYMLTKYFITTEALAKAETIRK